MRASSCSGDRGGAWTTWASTRADATGRWRATARFTAGGPAQVRARVGRRTSAPRSLAVYEWLDLAAQPIYTSSSAFRDVPVPIGGTTLPHSLLALNSTAPALWWNLGRACTELTWTTGFDDRDRLRSDQTETLGTKAVGYRADGGVAAESAYLTADWDTPRAMRLGGIDAATRVSLITVLSDPDNDGLGVPVGTPRARCNAAGLAAFGPDDFPTP